MRTRFKKVWCGSCGTMQFAGECPHGRVEAPAAIVVAEVRKDKTHCGCCEDPDCRREHSLCPGQRTEPRPLILPAPALWTEYKLAALGVLAF